MENNLKQKIKIMKLMLKLTAKKKNPKKVVSYQSPTSNGNLVDKVYVQKNIICVYAF